MLNPTLTYESANAESARTPVYVAEIAGVTRKYSTHHLFDYLTEASALGSSGYYRLQEESGTVCVDVSGNGRNGTYVNTPTLGVAGALAGDSNKAMTVVTANSEWVSCPSAAFDPRTQTSYSFAIWVKPASSVIGADATFLGRTWSNPDRNGPILFQFAAGSRWAHERWSSGVGATVQSTTAPNSGRWDFIVGTYDGTNLRIYVNGVLEGTTAMAVGTVQALDATTPKIGYANAGVSFSGSLDEAQFFNGIVLSAATIKALYEAGLGLYYLTDVSRSMQLPRGIAAQIEPDRSRSSIGSTGFVLNDQSTYDAEVRARNPVAWWRFGHKTGNSQDSSGNGLHGIDTGGVAVGQRGALAGDNDLAILLDGTGYVSIPDNPLLDLGGDTLTIAFWIYPTTFAAPQIFFDKGPNGYVVSTPITTGIIQFGKNGFATSAHSSVPLTLNAWNFVFCVKSGSSRLIQLNGVDVTVLDTNQTIVATASDLAIGSLAVASGGPDLHYNGYFDEALLFATALTAADGVALYNSGKYNVGTKGEITRLITEGIGSKQVTFKAGFLDICYSDFITLPGGFVKNYPLAANLQDYNIIVQEPSSLLNQQLFQTAQSTLSADITDTDTSLSLGSATFFLSAGYVIIDDEILQYSGKTGTTLTGLIRGIRGTTPAAHTAGAAILEVLKIGPGHPCDIIRDCFTNTDKTGLSIDASIVDSAKYDTVKAAMGGYSMEFWITGRVNAKEWLEEELFSKIACYNVIRNAKLSIVRFAQPDPGDVVAALDHDSIIHDRTKPMLSWDPNFQTLVNSLVFQYDHDPVKDEFRATTDPIEDAASIALYERRVRRTISSRGLRPNAAFSADNFNRANSNSLGGSWTESEMSAATIKVALNEVFAGSDGANTGAGVAQWATATPSDQSSELVFRSAVSDGWSGPAVRLAGIYTTLNGYAAMYDPVGAGTGVLKLYKFFGSNLASAPKVGINIGGASTYIANLIDGDRVKIRAHGSLLYVYVNDVLRIGPIEDSDITVGVPGIVTNCDVGDSITWDSWVGGEDLGDVEEFIAAIAALILGRYAGGGAPIVRARTLLGKHLIEPGDIVSLTTPLLPNKSTKQRGLEEALFEVIGREMLFAQGQVDLTLLQTSWSL